jgi:hypothetical protein
MQAFRIWARELGPHLGRGYGGRPELTGKLEEDRAAVVAILRKQVERGDLDGILSTVDRRDAT